MPLPKLRRSLSERLDELLTQLEDRLIQARAHLSQAPQLHVSDMFEVSLPLGKARIGHESGVSRRNELLAEAINDALLTAGFSSQPLMHRRDGNPLPYAYAYIDERRVGAGPYSTKMESQMKLVTNDPMRMEERWQGVRGKALETAVVMDKLCGRPR